MEEYDLQQWLSVEEGDHSLLSHQMIKISQYPSHITLIASLPTAPPLPPANFTPFAEYLLPILSLANSFQFTPQPLESTVFKTVKIPHRKTKSNHSSSTFNTLESTTKMGQSLTGRTKKGEGGREGRKEDEQEYRFLRSERRERHCEDLLFEERVYSVKQINGQGYVLLRGGRVMEGEFVEGVPVGRTLIRFENGMVYVGPVYNYRPHGIGEMRMASGQRYVGQFCYGEPHGEGVHYDALGKVKREGEWKRGKFQQ